MIPIPMRLELFLAGTSRALSAYEQLIHEVLGPLGEYDLTVTDVLESPDRAEEAKVTGTPQLVRWFPGPTRRILGIVEDPDTLREHLETGLLLLGNDLLTMTDEGF